MKRAFCIFIIVTLIGSMLFLMLRGPRVQTLDPGTRFAGDAQMDIKDVHNQLQMKLRHENENPDNIDKMFYPAPAVNERLQSVQYEHLEDAELWFDLDYQQKYKFKLVAPTVHTTEAYQQATRDELLFMRRQMLMLFGTYTDAIGMTINTFNAPINALLDENERVIRKWRPSEVRLDVLQSRQRQLSDQAFDATAQQLLRYGLVVLPNGNVQKGGALRLSPNNTPSNAGFGNNQVLTIRRDGLSDMSRNTGVPFAQYTHEQVSTLASKFVTRKYEMLLDKYKYIIRDMPAEAFRAERPRIEMTGNDLLENFLDSKRPTQAGLDMFCTEVEEAMRDTLLFILVSAGVDVTQFT